MLHDTDLPNPPVDDFASASPSRASPSSAGSDAYARAYVENIAGIAGLAGLDRNIDVGADPTVATGVASVVTTPRFGRLAMCVATAGALAIGVMGTVAYGVWFNHDQQTYAAAIAGARQALGPGGVAKKPAVSAQTHGSPGVPSVSTEAGGEQGSRLSSWSGEVARPQASGMTVADAANANARSANAQSANAAANAGNPANAANTTAANATNVNAIASTSATSLQSDRRAPTAATNSRPPRQLASTRTAKDARTADSRVAAERRAADAKHKSLFARVGQFFHRVDYRQHGDASKQDIYSHP